MIPETEEQILQYCTDLDLPERTQALLKEIIDGRPVRNVKSGRSNVTAHFPSQKDGLSVQAESHTVELVFVHEYEYDKDVLGFLDQPYTMTLRYVAQNGRRVGVPHTPDFLVFRKHAIGFEECKPEAELIKLAKEKPNRYIRTEDGGWCCPPAEEWTSQYGFYYRVRSSAEINPIRHRNIVFLRDYLDPGCPPANTEIADAILAQVRLVPGITLKKLIEAFNGEASDDIYKLIAQRAIFADLDQFPLGNPQHARIFRDEITCRGYSAAIQTRAGFDRHLDVSISNRTQFQWDGRQYTILQRGETSTFFRAEDQENRYENLPNDVFDTYITQGQVILLPAQDQSEFDEKATQRYSEASPEDIEAALRIMDIIRPDLEERNPTEEEFSLYNSVAPRTRRHYRQKLREGEFEYGFGFLNLLPRTKLRGNRNDRLPEPKKQLLIGFISRDYENYKQKTIYAAHCAFKAQCERQGIPKTEIPVYETFYRYVKNRVGYEQSKKRRGRRGAYGEKPWIWLLEWTTARHGERPFEIAHLDHTQLDVELVCSQTGQNLGRPWLTLLIDAYSRRILAFYITFDPPSYRSCMMALRDCVRRHQRLPQYLIVDNGKEFHSNYFRSVLAMYGITIKYRPAAQPRFGSVMERIFNTLNTQYIHTLIGNTQIMTNVRQVTKSIEPKNLACWTLEALYAGTETWCFEIYDKRYHETLMQSPREAFSIGMRNSGSREHKRILYDETFRILTLPTTQKGTAKVQPRQGVKIKRSYYWSNSFLDTAVENTQVHVRYDPFDVSIAYALIKGRWTQCMSDQYKHYERHSERELMIASEELRKRKHRASRDEQQTAAELGEFLVSQEGKEATLHQRLCDAAVQNSLALLTSGHIVIEIQQSSPSTLENTTSLSDYPKYFYPDEEEVGDNQASSTTKTNYAILKDYDV